MVVNGLTDELIPDVVSTLSGITQAQTDKFAKGRKGVVEGFHGKRMFALR